MTTTTEAPVNELEQLENEHNENCKKFERMYRQYHAEKHAGQNNESSLDMIRLFATEKLGWDRRRFNDQSSRMHTVIREEKIAGTKEQRSQLDADLQKAEEILKTESPKIKKQIKELQNKLTTMEETTTSLRSRKGYADAAVKTLRESVPRFVAKRINEIRLSLLSTVGKDSDELRNELVRFKSYIEGVSVDLIKNYRGPPSSSPESKFARLNVLPYHPELVGYEKYGEGRYRHFLKPEFKEFVETLPPKIRKLEEQLKQAEAEHAQQLAENESLRDYYIV